MQDFDGYGLGAINIQAGPEYIGTLWTCGCTADVGALWVCGRIVDV
jgi:hypothetical protein